MDRALWLLLRLRIGAEGRTETLEDLFFRLTETPAEVVGEA